MSGLTGAQVFAAAHLPGMNAEHRDPVTITVTLDAAEPLRSVDRFIAAWETYVGPGDIATTAGTIQ